MSAKGTSIKDSFRSSVEKKLAKLGRFFDDDTAAHVTVSTEGGREKVEVTIKSGGLNFRSERTTADRLDSLDAVVDVLSRQIIKNKGKLEKRLRQNAFAPGYDADFVGVENTSYEIVKTKRFPLRPMTAEEAILQMNLVGHSFFVFRDSESGLTCVVYRRDNGDYGLLEPEGN